MKGITSVSCLLIKGDQELPEQLIQERLAYALEIEQALIKRRLQQSFSRSKLFLIEQSEYKHAYMKVRDKYGKLLGTSRLGYYPSRFERIADGQSGRLLLAEARTQIIIDSMLKEKQHEYLTSVEYRNLKRSINNAKKRLGHKPRSAFQVKPNSQHLEKA